VEYDNKLRVTLTAPTKACVCLRLFGRVAGSNPTGSMDVRLLSASCVFTQSSLQES
jgi:hypothetical protein